MLVVVNAARGSWQAGEYGISVGAAQGGSYEQVYCSMDKQYGGWGDWVSNPEPIAEHGGRIHINLPPQCTLFFVHRV